jgi:WD40 repeat protein
VAWSPDSTRLLSGSDDNTAKVWDTATGRCLRTLEGHQGGVGSVAWSPDGSRLLSGSYDNTARLWDAATGRCLLTLTGHQDWVTSVTWSPNGTRILTSSRDSTIREWDASTGKLLRTWLSIGKESALLDFATNRILHASPGVWRHLGWQGWDPKENRRRLLPAEAFGPLPPW